MKTGQHAGFRATLAGIFAGFGLLAPWAWSAPMPVFPDAREFLQVVSERDRAPAPLFKSALGAGQAAFVATGSIIRGQGEISVDNIREEKFAERLQNGDIVWKAGSDTTLAGGNGYWHLAHDSGRSPIPLNDPISVIKGPQGFIILDGHHDFYLALYLGARTVPVDVKEDLSNLSAREFWENLKARNLVYLDQSAESLAQSPPKTGEVLDNPNRYLATLLALKVKTGDKDGPTSILKIKGAKAGAWIKHNDSRPFIEFYIAKILNDAGIRYEASWGQSVPSSVVEKSRNALIAAAKSGNHPELEGIPLFVDLAQARAAYTDPEFLKRVLFPAGATAAVSCAAVFSD